MFNKKNKCNNCGNKINKDYSFCPECGNNISQKNNKKEWGMIGKNDSIEDTPDIFSTGLFGGLGGKMLNQMLNSTMKMLEKEMKKSMEDINKVPQNKTNFELYINGKKISPDKIKVTNKPLINNKIQEKYVNKFLSEENTKKFSELVKEEPETNLRRLSDMIVYEISLPGVKNIEDISIVKLEKSIEIKAVSKNKAYSKIIPFNLNITKYNLSKEKLVLELKE